MTAQDGGSAITDARGESLAEPVSAHRPTRCLAIAGRQHCGGPLVTPSNSSHTLAQPATSTAASTAHAPHRFGDALHPALPCREGTQPGSLFDAAGRRRQAQQPSTLARRRTLRPSCPSPIAEPNAADWAALHGETRPSRHAKPTRTNPYRLVRDGPAALGRTSMALKGAARGRLPGRPRADLAQHSLSRRPYSSVAREADCPT